MGWWIWGGKVDTIQLIIALFAWTFTTRIQSENEKCINCFDKKSLSCVWSEASLCNVSSSLEIAYSTINSSHQLTSSPLFDWDTSMSFAGSAIAQGVNCLEDLVRGFPSTKWLLLAGSSDPPCKTSTRRARDCDRGSTFLRGVTNDLALMEKSPTVKNCLHNTVR